MAQFKRLSDEELEFYNNVEFWHTIRDQESEAEASEDKAFYKQFLRELKLEFYQKHGWEIVPYLK